MSTTTTTTATTTEIPATMRAATYSRYGAPDEVIEVVSDAPTPTLHPESNKLLIRVHAAAPNPIDYKILQGDFQMVIKKPFPRVIGFDGSGVIAQIGEGVDASRGFSVGQEVFFDGGFCGSFAEYAAVDSRHVVSKPSNLSHNEAAAIPLAGLTSYQVLRHKAGLKAGEKVLVLGGSGGTGGYAIQIAAALGASEIATTSSNVELVTGLGATTVVNYRNEDWGEVLAGQNFDVVFDCVGGKSEWVKAQRVLKPRGGRFVSIVGDSAARLTFGRLMKSIGQNMNRKFWSLFGYPSYLVYLTDASATADLEALRDLAEAGKLRVVLDDSREPYTLETVADMLKAQMGHRTKGKMVVQVV